MRNFLVLCLLVLAAAVVLLGIGAGLGVFLVFGLLTLVAFAINDRAMRRPGGIPCLTWHSVSADPRWLPWAKNTSVTPTTLDRQLSQLRRMGLAPLDTRAFCALRRAGKPVPENSVMLHFDDGYRDNLIAAEALLRKHDMCATLFVSIDFIAPDREITRSIALDTSGPLGADYTGPWDGYLSWREIKALDSGPLQGVFDVQPHGVEHGRVPTSDTIVDVLTQENWRHLAWMQWAKMPGNKHDWYLAEQPPAVPLGTPVPESGSGLAQRAWAETKGRESEADFEARVQSDFEKCREAFRVELDKTPEVFCWPQNLTNPGARILAKGSGYLATTAGKGNNRGDESPEIISRLHVGERYAGFECQWIDDVAFKASVRCFQGNHYWYLVLAPIHILNKVFGKIGSRPQKSRNLQKFERAQ